MMAIYEFSVNNDINKNGIPPVCKGDGRVFKFSTEGWAQVFAIKGKGW